MANKIKSYVGKDIVIECKSKPTTGRSVFIDTPAGRIKIARTYDIIGTTDSPFVVAKIFKENERYIKSYEELINKLVYFGIKKNVKKGRGKWKKKWRGKRKQK